jgi:hypothetical protein
MRDEDGHNAMLVAGGEWRRIKMATKRMWSGWTTKIGPALVKARAEAMAIACTNKPAGKGYNTAMSGLLQEYKLHDMEAVARNDVLSIMEHLPSVEAWHAKQRNREKLNHPTTVWRHFKNSDEYKADLMARGEYSPVGDESHSSLKALDEEQFTVEGLAGGDGALANAHDRICELESQLNQARVEAIDRSVAAASRLPEAPVFDLSSESGIADAVSAFIVTYGVDLSRAFAAALLGAIGLELESQPQELKRELKQEPDTWAAEKAKLEARIMELEDELAAARNNVVRTQEKAEAKKPVAVAHEQMVETLKTWADGKSKTDRVGRAYDLLESLRLAHLVGIEALSHMVRERTPPEDIIGTVSFGVLRTPRSIKGTKS